MSTYLVLPGLVTIELGLVCYTIYLKMVAQGCKLWILVFHTNHRCYFLAYCQFCYLKISALDT